MTTLLLIFCFSSPLVFSAWLAWKVHFSGPKQLKENSRALLSDVQNKSEAEVWFYGWLARRRAGEVLTGSTVLTEYEIQLGFYDAKKLYLVGTVCYECFSISNIRTASDFVEQLERHLERHRR